MVVPTVRSLTEIPIISPSVNSEFISGSHPLGLVLAEMPIDMQRLRVKRHVGEQHVVPPSHGAPQAMLVDVADRKVLEIEAASAGCRCPRSHA